MKRSEPIPGRPAAQLADPMAMWRRAALACSAISLSVLLGGCAVAPGTRPAPTPTVSASDAASQRLWLGRVSWGDNVPGAARLAAMGLPAWLGGQLHPDARHDALPAPAQAQIDALAISQTPVDELMRSLEAERKAADALPDEDARKVARQAYQQRLNLLAREAQQRFLLRALYSPNQLQSQMTWFWMNHFNVDIRKGNIRALVGDYEERAIRPYALGRFRDLLGATVHHPAMLRYLDNEQNAANRLNENYARELMELHTMGVGSGYSQQDVQEMARVLTGVGVTLREPAEAPPRLRPELQADYVRQGLFEFNPNRHDYRPKMLLGAPLAQRGMAEVDEALDRLARAPATAHFISNKLAVYFVADTPPAALVDRMAATFQRSDGDIAAVLQTMFESPEFTASLGRKFRDPVHYVLGSVRLAYGDRVVANVNPMLGWINRLGEPLYAHSTPEGYPLTQAAWSSPGQMSTLFEIARAIGTGGAVLFRTDDKAPLEKPPFPALAESEAVKRALPAMGAGTRDALAQARSPQDWNTFLLASPELMRR